LPHDLKADSNTAARSVVLRPEIQARIDRILDQTIENSEANEQKLSGELLRLLGLMSVQFNILEAELQIFVDASSGRSVPT
jgi:hypothetical protein